VGLPKGSTQDTRSSDAASMPLCHKEQGFLNGLLKFYPGTKSMEKKEKIKKTAMLCGGERKLAKRQINNTRCTQRSSTAA
jgi:hypothetical protein